MTFNQRFHEERVKRNMSQEEFAEMLNISQPAVSAYESGDRTPPFDRAKKIARFLNVSLGDIFPKYKI